MPLCPARTRKGARQPVSKLTAAYAPKKTRDSLSKTDEAHLAAQSSFDATSPARALDENAFAALCNERKSSRRQRSKLRLSAMRSADKRGRHSRRKNKNVQKIVIRMRFLRTKKQTTQSSLFFLNSLLAARLTDGFCLAFHKLLAVFFRHFGLEHFVYLDIGAYVVDILPVAYAKSRKVACAQRGGFRNLGAHHVGV